MQRYQDVDIHIRALSDSELKLWVDTSSKITSYYRKSEFHQQVTLAKRSFLLNQGFLFLDKLRHNLGQSVLPKTSGLAIYFAFRFEEVIGKLEAEKLFDYYKATLPDSSKSLKFMLRLHRVMTRPSKLRKGISYLIYRFYSI
ncbi:hypothetical protein [Algoriphagus formosus]|uniref:hypothetical protein n=1 Tax=Algoriphagus formosus TaxID=2007308 RepID=UPI003F6FF909